MKTIQKIRDGKYSVELYTFGSGEPLLYLHGAGGLLGVDPFLDELGKDFKVIAPHLPGFGESTGGDYRPAGGSVRDDRIQSRPQSIRQHPSTRDHAGPSIPRQDKDQEHCDRACTTDDAS